jgi:hypothetical protein
MTETKIENTVLILCRSRQVQEKLEEAYAHLALHDILPFEIRVEVNPDSGQLDKLRDTTHCLIFIETDPASPGKSVLQLDSIRKKFCNAGHQFVLLANSQFDYLRLAMKFDIGNILLEDQFDHQVIAALTKKLMADDFFGFAPFFPEGYPVFDQKYEIKGEVSISRLEETFFQDFIDTLDEDQSNSFSTYIYELAVNALAYGVYGITAEEREQEGAALPTVIQVPDEKAIQVHIVRDSEKFGISVIDQKGTLRPSRILKKIQRHTSFDIGELPPGIEDPSGRGLFILSQQTRLVVNILLGIKTEVIVMHFFDEKKNKYQSLIINEKRP